MLKCSGAWLGKQMNWLFVETLQTLRATLYLFTYSVPAIIVQFPTQDIQEMSYDRWRDANPTVRLRHLLSDAVAGKLAKTACPRSMQYR